MFIGLGELFLGVRRITESVAGNKDRRGTTTGASTLSKICQLARKRNLVSPREEPGDPVPVGPAKLGTPASETDAPYQTRLRTRISAGTRAGRTERSRRRPRRPRARTVLLTQPLGFDLFVALVGDDVAVVGNSLLEIVFRETRGDAFRNKHLAVALYGDDVVLGFMT